MCKKFLADSETKMSLWEIDMALDDQIEEILEVVNSSHCTIGTVVGTR
jgi:hypothetical protein